jgi:hypothetical protein
LQWAPFSANPEFEYGGRACPCKFMQSIYKYSR